MRVVDLSCLRTHFWDHPIRLLRYSVPTYFSKDAAKAEVDSRGYRVSSTTNVEGPALSKNSSRLAGPPGRSLEEFDVIS